MAESQAPPPTVGIVGAGIAGLTAALRLSQRGYRVKLFEARDYIGGKLGAHRGELFQLGSAGLPAGRMPGNEAEELRLVRSELDQGALDNASRMITELFRLHGRPLDSTVAVEVVEPGHEWTLSDRQGGRQHLVRRICTCREAPPEDEHLTFRFHDGGAYHEHCYHMYLNWYHNFWKIVEDPDDGLAIKREDSFSPCESIYLMRAGDFPNFKKITNSGALSSALENLLSGVEPPADMFLWSYALLDLLSQPFDRGDVLSKYSVTGFLGSRSYSTNRSASLYDTTIAKAFAIRAPTSSAASYKSFLKYGYYDPEPQLWTLNGNTYDHLLGPLEKKLAALGCEILLNERIDRVLLQRDDAGRPRVWAIRSRCPESPVDGHSREATYPVDYLILAVPPAALGRLVADPEGDADLLPSIAEVVPELTGARHLRTEAMAALDLYLKKRLTGIPKGVVVMRDSPFDLTFLDLSQTWQNHTRLLAGDQTVLNVVATNYQAIPNTVPEHEGFAIIRELCRYLSGFNPGSHWGDPDSDIDWDRTFVRVDTEGAIFINEAGSEDFRPKTSYPALPNLAIAGEYCDTVIDAATIEGAVVSGLEAARAIYAQQPLGKPIEVITPPSYPESAMMLMKYLLAPSAYAAKALSMAYDTAGLATGASDGAAGNMTNAMTNLMLAPYRMAGDYFWSLYNGSMWK